jgi:hypothetical protein
MKSKRLIIELNRCSPANYIYAHLTVNSLRRAILGHFLTAGDFNLEDDNLWLSIIALYSEDLL